jgi:hypothetical protein
MDWAFDWSEKEKNAFITLIKKIQVRNGCWGGGGEFSLIWILS